MPWPCVPFRGSSPSAARPIRTWRSGSDASAFRRSCPSPSSFPSFQAAIQRAAEAGADLQVTFADAVGRVLLRDMQDRVREAMLEQALAQSGGSLSGAARLLGVSRQAVQQMVKQGRSGG